MSTSLSRRITKLEMGNGAAGEAWAYIVRGPADCDVADVIAAAVGRRPADDDKVIHVTTSNSEEAPRMLSASRLSRRWIEASTKQEDDPFPGVSWAKLSLLMPLIAAQGRPLLGHYERERREKKQATNVDMQ